MYWISGFPLTTEPDRRESNQLKVTLICEETTSNDHDAK